MARSSASQFSHGGGFSVRGPRTGRDSLLLTAGAALLWTNRISIYACDIPRTRL
jgi:hypothetical protein